MQPIRWGAQASAAGLSSLSVSSLILSPADIIWGGGCGATMPDLAFVH